MSDRVRVYLVGVIPRDYIYNEFETPYVLASYYAYKGKDGIQKLKGWCDDHSDSKLLLDSGAFSAWSRKIKLNIQDYIDFIYSMDSREEHYINLDDIEDYNQTWENQREMERQGLDPVPVYHYGEPISILNKIMDNYEYFGVGGIALRKSIKIRVEFFDMIFKRLCTKKTDYKPSHKIHGFGMTMINLVLRYPWYSVDSRSWLNAGRFGEVMVPKRRKGKWVYDDRVCKMTVSRQSIRRINKSLYNKSLKIRKKIFEYFGENGFMMGESEFKKVSEGYRLGRGERWADDALQKIKKRRVEKIIDLGLCNDCMERDKINYLFFLDFMKSMPDYGWKFKTKVQTLGVGW